MKNFKYHVNNTEKLDNFVCQSQAGQDLFVIAMLQGKFNGTFLEIGAGFPIIANNTWLLESRFNFTGISMDVEKMFTDVTADMWKNFYNAIRDSRWPDASSIDQLPEKIQSECRLHGYEEYVINQGKHTWDQTRPGAVFYQADATKFNWSILPKHVDYLQIDIDTPMNNFAVLKEVTKNCQFSVITFEHDAWTLTPESQWVRKEAREYLQSRGYFLLANDVCEAPGMSDPAVYPGLIHFEDWWVNPNTVGQDLIDVYKNITPEIVPKFYYEILFD